MLGFRLLKLGKLVREEDSTCEESSQNMQGQDELQVPVEELEELALALDYLGEGRYQRGIPSLL